MPLLPRPRRSSGGRTRFASLDLTREQWLIAFLIGLASVLAAVFGWRAAAIGSTAAFDDRQSISETITVERGEIDMAFALADDARDYTRYLADYAVAAELDNQAVALAAAGDPGQAADLRREALLLRRGATERAADAGVFGRVSIADDVSRPRPQPRPFDLDERRRTIAAEAATGLDSPGQLDPGVWAREAEDIRDRIDDLVVWAFLLIVAVLLFTAAQVLSSRRGAFYALLGLGCAVLLAGAVSGFTMDFVT